MTNLFNTIAQASNNNSAAAGGMIVTLFFLALYLGLIVLAFVGLWKTFLKAGRQGWEGFVPIYNYYVLNELSGREILWFVLMLVPCVQIVAIPLVCIDFAKKFGKSPAFGIGLAFLPFVFFPILGFGPATYQPDAPTTGGFPVIPPRA